MDGRQGPVAASLRFRLAMWLSIAIVAVAAGAGLVSFRLALAKAHALQDIQLQQTGYLISQLDAVPSSPMAREKAGDVDFVGRVVVRFLAAPGSPALAAPRPPSFPTGLADGLQTVRVDREQWRVFVKTNDKGVRVAVGQQTRVRDAAARADAVRTVMPILFLAPVLVLLVMVLVQQMFIPLRRLADELGRRQPQDLSQLGSTGLPAEVVPFVAQINALLIRTGRTLAMQRRFIADAAHELRSPLTAMSLQAERLSAAPMPDEARARLKALTSGLRRTLVLLEQLLALARTHEPVPGNGVSVDLEQVIREVLEDLVPLAEDKHIDLGVIGDVATGVRGSHFELKVLVKNLVDNAIRYTPEKGRVDITVENQHGQLRLLVDDTGPGIAPEDRERVFDPFYRVLGNGEMGSGLGLSIARTAAASLGASIGLGTAPTGGLRATVTFGSAPAYGQGAH